MSFYFQFLNNGDFFNTVKRVKILLKYITIGAKKNPKGNGFQHQEKRKLLHEN